MRSLDDFPQRVASRRRFASVASVLRTFSGKAFRSGLGSGIWEFGDVAGLDGFRGVFNSHMPLGDVWGH